MGAQKVKPLPRVVLDTNIVVSALLFGAGPLAWARGCWQAQKCIPLASRATILELVRVLAYPKFHLSHSEQEDVLADYLPFCEVVQIPTPPPITPKCRDPFDKIFMELALAGKANALVTGDKDLLLLASAFPLPILTAAELKTML